jgi:magnesium-transporting ATPase (P-type)
MVYNHNIMSSYSDMDMWFKMDKNGCPDFKKKITANVVVILIITTIIYLITVWAVQKIFQRPGRRYSYWAIFFILLAASIISSLLSAGLLAAATKAGVPMA